MPPARPPSECEWCEHGNRFGLAGAVPRRCGFGIKLVPPGLATHCSPGDPGAAKEIQPSLAAMAITEPSAGSDSASIRTTAKLDGEDYVLNGEKIFVTAGQRCDAVVVWATLDKSKGRAAIKSFVVPKSTRALCGSDWNASWGIKASDTATIRLTDCRVSKLHLWEAPRSIPKIFAGVMQTFDNTRPVVAAMAVGLASESGNARANCWRKPVLKWITPCLLLCAMPRKPICMRWRRSWNPLRLLTLKAAWMAEQRHSQL